MDVSALDTRTDYYAKTDSSSFPTAEKLVYYNEAYQVLASLIMDLHEEYYEDEKTKTTITDQSDYKEPARIHRVNWLKIQYSSDDGFIPASYRSHEDLIREYGDSLESELSSWPASDPIYNYRGRHFFVYPAPDSTQAGAKLLKISGSFFPADLSGSSDEPQLPLNFPHLLAEYAAMRYHENNAELNMAKIRKTNWLNGLSALEDFDFTRTRQKEHLVAQPDDDGSDY